MGTQKMGTRGYVTIATGKQRYYELAVNLLCSYRYHTPEENRLPFAILSNARNAFTDQFDNAIIVEDLPCSYMAKIDMLRCAPYEENIFIDADSLVYRDLSFIWQFFDGHRGVGILGHKLLREATNGWFKIGEVGVWSKFCKFCLVTHGGIMYFRRDDLTNTIYNTCLDIIPDYGKYKFQIFEKPADEPIIALSMAVNDCPPVEYSGEAEKVYCFMPVRDNIKMNIRKGLLSYGVDPLISDVCILHWQNNNTKLPIYYQEVDRLKYTESVVVVRFVLRSLIYFFIGYIPKKYYEFKSFVWRILH